jgi:hypothetical protein
MVWHFEKVEPEPAHARENAALVRDARRQNPIEGADAIAGDDDEPVAQIVDIAHLAAPARHIRNPAFEQRRPHRTSSVASDVGIV